MTRTMQQRLYLRINDWVCFGCDNGAVGIDSNLTSCERGLDRVASLENAIQFLQGALASLRHHEVEDGGLNTTPDGVDDVGPPADAVECDGPSELVEDRALAAV